VLDFAGIGTQFPADLQEWFVDLKNEDEAKRFLAALLSNEAFAEQNPGWPRMNSTRTLDLGDVSGLNLIL
jgi:hypothetical protein